MTLLAPVSVGIEGPVDEAAIGRLFSDAGGLDCMFYGRQGREWLRQRVSGYNSAARHAPWMILVDLDADECAPALKAAWLPNPAPQMCFRVAVREVETWFLADRANIAAFLHVSEALVPPNPESVSNPKETMVNLARRSRSREIRAGMVPGPKSGRPTGPAYSANLIEFVYHAWSPRTAARRSDSLARAIRRIRTYSSSGVWT
jgi:hypothetical protein